MGKPSVSDLLLPEPPPEFLQAAKTLAGRLADRVWREVLAALTIATELALPRPQVVAVAGGVCIEWCLPQRRLSLYFDSASASDEGSFWLAHWAHEGGSLSWPHEPGWPAASREAVRAFLGGAELAAVQACLGPPRGGDAGSLNPARS